MRLLITTHGGAGHFHPLAPIADAALARDHDVLFAVEPPFDEHIERAGYAVQPIGMSFDFGAPERTFPEIDDHRGGLEGAMWAMEHVFFGALAEAALPDVERLVDDWLPDVVLNETSEVAGLLVAERRGIAHATFNYGGMDLSTLRFVAGAAWDRLRARQGLPPDPDLAAMTESLVVAAMPASWAGGNASPRLMRIALPLFDRSGNQARGGRALRDGPLVYATLGTVNRDADVIGAVVEALGQVPLEALVTTGAVVGLDLAGPVPGNVELAAYVPNSSVLPRACAVVHHGGFNTLLGALRFGLPQVLMPMDADQPLNAARAEELGFAIVLPPDRRTPSDIASALLGVIDDPLYRDAARRMQAEIDALEPVSAAVDALALLAPGGA